MAVRGRSGDRWDLAVIGGGIVGLATAYQILRNRPALRVLVLEKESDLAMHQTGHNSGVLHAGLYYPPGSRKARLCREGKEELERFAREKGIPFERCGKLVIAVDAGELDRLAAIRESARANGIEGVEEVGPERMREIEPHAAGARGLWSPSSGIIDFRRVALACAAEVAARRLVRGLIYPVPDPRLPFLGIHFTKRIDGEVLAGPNAVLAFAREGYRRRDFSPRDLVETLAFPGFRRLARRHFATGLAETWRDFSKRAFTASLARFVPEIRRDDLVFGPSGVRAQSLSADGRLVDDFSIGESSHVLHVRNAPSPAATASLAIGRELAEMAAKRFGWDS